MSLVTKLRDFFVSLCVTKGVFSDPLKRDDLKWIWLKWWAETLFYDDEGPTWQQLDVLANAYLNAHQPDIARAIAKKLLDEDGELGLGLNPLTKAHLLLMVARASKSPAEKEDAKSLLEKMPTRDDLIGDLESSAAAP